ncbi:MAG: YjbH domain-containing protein [Alphaproteobacteria bacterium]|nr:YjbH domain-containing protein [Alphaproteobacteria bacterium]
MSATAPAGAQEQQSNRLRDTYGEIGILDLPSAHMANDGELAFSVGDVGSAQRYNLSFQFLPWLEGTFRYVRVDPVPQDYQRNFSLKIRLSREGNYVPDISFGIRDLIGNNAYNGEYLAASKHIGSLDFTAGLGWGRLAESGTLPNPFGYVSSSFKSRNVSTPSTGGTVNFGRFFHGPRTGVFGGAIWHTPVDGLSLLAEYSTDKYTREGAIPGGVKVRSPVNLGLSYQLVDALSVSAGWYYGSTYGFTIALRGDPTKEPGSTARIGPAVPPPVFRDNVQQQKALSLMLDRNAHVAAVAAGSAWVHVPTETERTKLDLTQALLSEGRGVRDIDVEGATLVVDAARQANADAQCAKYAEIASATGARAKTVAMTDLQSADGLVTICPIASRARYAQNTTQDADASKGTTAGATDQAAFERTLRADMSKQSLYMDALSLGTSELWLYYQNGRYRSESEAAGRIVRLLMADAPPTIEIFHLIPTLTGLPAQEITVVRSALERATVARSADSSIGDTITLSTPPLDNPALDRAAASNYPYVYWSLDPKLTEHLFDPDKPLQFMVYADAAAGVVLAPGLTLGVELTANVWNDYTLGRGAGSVLPHVRTDLLQYVRHGQNGISNLQGVYRTRLARDVFAEVKAGYLEDMYMGGGGQVLWRPENSRIAINVDIYQVWKRDFDRLFGAQSYNVLTGHASIYYQSPWYGLNLKVHVGRYLAGDYGATFEVTRRFSTGVEIGAYATFTNVPFSRFGEGSFDKGITLHIPFEWGLPLYSQSVYDLHLSALTRDGGQRLGGDDSLYADTRETSYGEIAEHFDELIEP